MPRADRSPHCLRLGLAALALAAAALLAACVPQVAPPGPGLAVHELSGPAFTATAFVTDDGSTLPLRTWQPPQGVAPHGVVLALHGFNDYSHAFAESGPALAARGLVVYAYDQRGFGEAPHRGLWPGVDVLTGDLATASELVAARHPDLPLYLLGESMGGAVILAALGGPAPPQAAGVILAAPAVWGRSAMPFHQRAALWLSARLIPWARFSGRGLGIQASDNIEMLRALGRDPLFIRETRTDTIYGLVNLMDTALQSGPRIDERTLLLYGQRDEVVPADPTFTFWRSLPEAAAARQRFAYYPEGWHMLLRDLQAGVVIADIAAWARDPGAPLPSGAEAHAAAALAGEKPVAAGSEEDAEDSTAEAACGGITC